MIARFSLLRSGGVLAATWLVSVGLFGRGALAAEVPHTSLNPGRGMSEQIVYMRKHWPDQFAVAVVEVVGPPTRMIEEKGVAYSDQEVRPVDWIFLRWFTPSPQAPGDRFRIHYWIQPKKGERQLGVGERVIVFLVPSHFQGTFVTEMILTATEKNISEARQAMGNIIP